MPLYMSILKYVNSPTSRWGPDELEHRVGRYGTQNKLENEVKPEAVDNFGFELNESQMHRF
jgi:hypothetical protein